MLTIKQNDNKALTKKVCDVKQGETFVHNGELYVKCFHTGYHCGFNMNKAETVEFKDTLCATIVHMVKVEPVVFSFLYLETKC